MKLLINNDLAIVVKVFNDTCNCATIVSMLFIYLFEYKKQRLWDVGFGMSDFGSALTEIRHPKSDISLMAAI